MELKIMFFFFFQNTLFIRIVFCSCSACNSQHLYHADSTVIEIASDLYSGELRDKQFSEKKYSRNKKSSKISFHTKIGIFKYIFSLPLGF